MIDDNDPMLIGEVEMIEVAEASIDDVANEVDNIEPLRRVIEVIDIDDDDEIVDDKPRIHDDDDDTDDGPVDEVPADNNAVTNDDGHLLGRTGQKISARYTIVEELGMGIFARVYQTVDNLREGNPPKAIKVTKNVPVYEQAANMEIDFLRHLNKAEGKGNDAHRKFIVQLKHIFYFHDHLCLVFPVYGPNLYHYMSDKYTQKFTVAETLEIGYQLVAAVAFMHARRLVHTDIKPENLMFVANEHWVEERTDAKGNITMANVRSDMRVRLTDFNSALTFEAVKNSTELLQTFNYRSPEVILGIPVTEKIDIFSVGCCLYEFASGGFIMFNTPPVEGETDEMEPNSSPRGRHVHLMAMDRWFHIPSSILRRCTIRGMEYLAKDFYTGDFEYGHTPKTLGLWMPAHGEDPYIHPMRRLVALEGYSDDAFHLSRLVGKMLLPNWESRPTAEMVEKHQIFDNVRMKCKTSKVLPVEMEDTEVTSGDAETLD